MPHIAKDRANLIIADAKSSLQEFLQDKHNEGPEYLLKNEEGPAHARIFTIAACFQGEELGMGTATSKKEAEQQAARAALGKLKQEAGESE